jgi:hypothetical protein
MKKATKRTLLLCLLSTLAAGVATPLQGADPAQPTEPATKPAPAQPTVSPPQGIPAELEGKVVVVNRVDQTVTVEINGKLYLFNVNSRVKLLKNGRSTSFQNLLAGQKITLFVNQKPDGSLELMSLQVDPTPTGNEAAGPKAPGQPPGSDKNSKIPPPFQNGNSPGNVERVVVSPNS